MPFVRDQLPFVPDVPPLGGARQHRTAPRRAGAGGKFRSSVADRHRLIGRDALPTSNLRPPGSDGGSGRRPRPPASGAAVACRSEACVPIEVQTLAQARRAKVVKRSSPVRRCSRRPSGRPRRSCGPSPARAAGAPCRGCDCPAEAASSGAKRCMPGAAAVVDAARPGAMPHHPDHERSVVAEVGQRSADGGALRTFRAAGPSRSSVRTTRLQDLDPGVGAMARCFADPQIVPVRPRSRRLLVPVSGRPRCPAGAERPRHPPALPVGVVSPATASGLSDTAISFRETQRSSARRTAGAFRRETGTISFVRSSMTRDELALGSALRSPGRGRG
ncbi:hypothetical protein SHIRM173S_05547 [Streptomyces hirsutus]